MSGNTRWIDSNGGHLHCCLASQDVDEEDLA